MSERLPVGVCIRTIRATADWWLESAQRLDAAGYAGVWAWDHFVGMGDRTVPVVEAWTVLSAAAATTSRVTVGPFVINVMNRHPAVLARMATTLQVVSGWPARARDGHRRQPARARGARDPVPRRSPERVARLEEAVAVLRALWSPGPVTRPSPFYPLDDADRQPAAGPATADHHRRRDPGRGETGRPDRRRLVDVRGQLRGEPAGLSRGARGVRATARGPAGHRRVPGPRLARVTSSWRAPRGSRRRARRGRAGRRPAPTTRSSPSGRPPMSTRSSPRPTAGRRARAAPRAEPGSRRVGPGPWHHDARDPDRISPDHRADPELHPLRRDRPARDVDVRELQPARAQAAGPEPGPRDGLRGDRRGGHRPGDPRAAGPERDRPVRWPRRQHRVGPARSGGHPDRDEPGDVGRVDDLSDLRRRARPAWAPMPRSSSARGSTRARPSRSRRRSRSSAARSGRSPSSAPGRDGPHARSRGRIVGSPHGRGLLELAVRDSSSPSARASSSSTDSGGSSRSATRAPRTW